MPLSSRKEDRMKKSTIQKKKLIMSGSILSVRRATSSLPCCWPWSAWPVCFPSSSLSWSLWQTNKVCSPWLPILASKIWIWWLPLLGTVQRQNLASPSSLPCLWPLWEQHVMSLSPQLMLTLSHGVPLNTASSLPYFPPLVCSLVQGWFQATLSPLNSCS